MLYSQGKVIWSSREDVAVCMLLVRFGSFFICILNPSDWRDAATSFDQDDSSPPLYEETAAGQMDGDTSEEDEEEQTEPQSEPTRFGWIQGVMVGSVGSDQQKITQRKKWIINDKKKKKHF